MRSRLTGTLEHLDPPPYTAPPAATLALHLNTDNDHATAFDVLVPAYVADRLEDQRRTTITLHTIEILEAQGQGSHLIPRLIGFTQRDDRAFFNLFTTVKNLGPRKALRAMTAPPAAIAAAIAAKDPKALAKLPGIGQRLAETIIAELAGKADRYATPTPPAAQVEPTPTLPPDAQPAPDAAPPTTAAADAASALTRLGTPRPEAERRVANAIASNPELADPDATADRLLAAALAANP